MTRLSIVPCALALGVLSIACGDDPGENPGGFADAAPVTDTTTTSTGDGDGDPDGGMTGDGDGDGDGDTTTGGPDDDTAGPRITITKPGPVELVSGIIEVTATVTDASGVASVQGTLGRGQAFDLTSAGGDTYSAFVNTRVFTNPIQVYPLLEITAVDNEGNERTVGYEISLDNRRPLVSLDSPLLREYNEIAGTGAVGTCSKVFDPLGDDAVNFGQIVPQLFEIRARVEDRGNGPDDAFGVVLPIATVNLDSVELYLLDEDNLALIVDLDNDGVCDEINPDVDPVLNPQGAEASLLSMSSVAVAGSSRFDSTFDVPPGSSPAIADATCSAVDIGDEGGGDELLCRSVLATRAIATETDNPAIFGLTPVDGLRCMGNALDSLANQISDGWVCLAVRAEDTVGNVGVSAVLPVCIDTDGTLDGDACSGTNNGNGTITPPAGVCPTSCTDAPDFSDFPGRQMRLIGQVEEDE